MKICEICKKTISEDEVFGVDKHESVCFECAEAEALKAKEEKREIQITHGEFAEAWSLCQWCDSLFPESATSDTSADTAFPPSVPGARKYG